MWLCQELVFCNENHFKVFIQFSSLQETYANAYKQYQKLKLVKKL